MKKPLSGIRVIDFTKLLPGPMCTLHLADMGAEVIRIEDAATPNGGDISITWDNGTNKIFKL